MSLKTNSSRKRFRILILAVLVGLVTACGDETAEEVSRSMNRISDLSEAEWKSLEDKRIYFGHQSVGANILTGIGEILQEHPEFTLGLQDLGEVDGMIAPGLTHSKNGTNKQPASKIRAFEKTMSAGLGGNVDLAFFKFCYVDIREKTDIVELFGEYSRVMTDLENRYPSTRFIHCTVPLTTVQTGLKAWVKGLIGRPLEGVADNINRTRFNRMLIQHYGADGTVFDLAGVESILPEGGTVSFKSDDETYPALAPEYTYDGGHLNEAGRRRVAEQLLVFLAKAVN